MAVEVVLLKDVKNLGESGDIVSVKEGYARNYLLVAGLATLATEKAKKQAEKLQKEREAQKQAEKEALLGRLKELEGMELEFKRKSEDGELFGSVSVKDILEALEEKAVKLNKDQVKLKKEIKEIGVYEADLILDKDAKVKIKIIVLEEKK